MNEKTDLNFKVFKHYLINLSKNISFDIHLKFGIIAIGKIFKKKHRTGRPDIYIDISKIKIKTYFCLTGCGDV